MPDESVAWGSFSYPKFLFEPMSPHPTEVAPSAVFDPIAATAGHPFAGATPPCMEPKPKVLLVVANLLPYAQRLGLLAFLERQGFRILLRCASSPDEAEEPLIIPWSNCSSA